MTPYENIKAAIITGEFEPGKRLTEEALANQFNVSRTPIREAIKQLEVDGLVTPFQRRGVIVREFSLKDIKQIYNLRALLESYGASEAAVHRTETDVIELRKRNEDYKQAIDRHTNGNLASVKDIQEKNQLFHDYIFQASYNDHLRALISKVVVVPLIFRSFYWYTKQQLNRSIDVHDTVLIAIENKEADRAKIAMQEHIYQGRDDVIRKLKENSHHIQTEI